MLVYETLCIFVMADRIGCIRWDPGGVPAWGQSYPATNAFLARSFKLLATQGLQNLTASTVSKTCNSHGTDRRGRVPGDGSICSRTRDTGQTKASIRPAARPNCL